MIVNTQRIELTRYQRPTDPDAIKSMKILYSMVGDKIRTYLNLKYLIVCVREFMR